MARRRRARIAALVALVLAAALTEIVASDAMQRELTLSFTSEAQAGSELPVNGSFVFDGSTSDIARQLYLRHAAGDSIDKCVPNTIPAAVTARLAPLNVSFDNLPGLLQRALLWDSGYVISPENDAVQIWTLGGRSMANLAISKVEFDTAGCTALDCSQPDDTTYNANEYCTGTQMLTAAKCLMDNFDSDTSSHLAMWSDGGDSDMVPEIRAVMHGWLDSSTNDSYLLYAVHTMTVDAEPAYGMCNKGGYGSLVVPCYPMSNTSADIVAVMSAPVATPWVTTWIKQYQPTSDTTVNSESDSDGGGFNLWLLGPILLSAVVASILIAFALSTTSTGTVDNSHGITRTSSVIASDFDPSNASVVSSEICCYRASIFYSDVSCSPVFGSRVEFCTASITRSGFYSSIIRSEFASTVRSGFFPSASMSPILEFMPSIRDSIQADRESIPALRETFCRYSATDNVQYTLTTDSNLIGKRIAWERIELGRLLSRGAFGEVWACRYAGKRVAVKRLLQTRKHTFLETEKFMNEIQLTASLNHPNIVRFIGVTWSSLENLAMVEEHLPRGDLQNYLKRSGDLMTWARDKIDMAIGIARAIDYLHSRQVIHRDIKARNILLTKRLQPKLIDFGTSRLWEPNDMSAGVGTPFWTAPEVLESSEYTEKADIYSFGVLLTELDTCEAPYHNTLGANGEKMKPFHVLKEVVDGTLRPSLSTGCPQRICKAADACFQHDPDLRPSASELVRMLEG
ncbi:hypothetical protein JG688_00002486 [Phytophthora aleatoria]|uniref:Protein kinase domain-containing protein n=1 Tax=Phytophthora aleatoria TaxID=2496075 RepID=A0A8J5MCQ9_9STRA|nr:hypothetical protein JG688_00002486 [Phytophthora aleatoria]